MEIINLFGGPGTGKSTTSAGLFYHMKLNNISVELVTEFAKDLVWDNRSTDDQIQILGEQYHRLWRLQNKVQYVVTDSPLFLSVIYGEIYMPQWQHFAPFVNELVNSFSNINVFLNRVKPFHQAGRYQTETQARELDRTILAELADHQHDIHFTVDADIMAPVHILNFLTKTANA